MTRATLVHHKTLNLKRLLVPKEIFNLVHDSHAIQGFDRRWQRMQGMCFHKFTKLLKQYIYSFLQIIVSS
ncbi:hypothetical protein N7537_010159 [Penicillium hordei]|uniref:Uncharacterized protein n=1 Tax=Penicillium hordei TaxID=40994 RepID=A0AAD6DU45_9EURO|nr:uncharacterized protein N7537_010159 [Penicillium hordei]KAJ5593255.1 hypothetical protein N7537_010159 [Penicillium hordei]